LNFEIAAFILQSPDCNINGNLSCTELNAVQDPGVTRSHLPAAAYVINPQIECVFSLYFLPIYIGLLFFLITIICHILLLLHHSCGWLAMWAELVWETS